MLTYMSERRTTAIHVDFGPARQAHRPALRSLTAKDLMIAGHDKIVAHVMQHGVPRVSLFLGPKSVGKRRLANQHARQHVTDDRDILRINRLTAELAREVGSFVRTAPAGKSGLRFVIIDIDGAPEANLNVLLKSLEEMTIYSFVILIASTPPIDTIVSRSEEIFRFSLLTDAEVEQALIYRGLGKTEAEIRAAEAGGQLSAVREHDDRTKLKSLVLIVVRCVREHDKAALEARANRWTDEHTDLLVKLAHEATSKRWRMFNEDEAGGIPGRVWLAILKALKPDVRPRLVIHSQLAGVLRSIS